MMLNLFAAGAFLAINVLSLMIAGWRIWPRLSPQPKTLRRPPVSVVIPLCGLEEFSRETLQSAFRLDWPDYEVIFCIADAKDPVIPLIEEVRLRHPAVPATILVGDDRISANPKLNNCVKGWSAAAHEWVVLADSNVLMPADYLIRLMAAWRSDSGLVCSTPLGSRPHGFWAEVECAFLNAHQARWQYAGEALGFGFAQGKSMLWRKCMLNAHGGIQALASEIAEDAAATKLVRSLGLKVHLVSAPFEQPLGTRTFREVWARQCRWARLRRVTFPQFFAPEILAGVVPPLILSAVAAIAAGHSLLPVAGFVATAAYLPELVLVHRKNWHLSRWSPVAMLTRDLLLPIIWVRSWLAGSADWRGNKISIGSQECRLEASGLSPLASA
ncbi:ceramide glucosyltransferase [Sinorhizobium fredii USDA 205]|uniref:Glycosyltransferase n=1 Tax=Rhizobium fredii TaxID=380 RepID=A0A844A4H2_RHIFR|nr:ceramide glucosyltransferase [Sinorhizobium fredii]ASY73568.1 Ceramide glucosyltransferase [Sinorhizobium fredii CCBAU 83666]AWM29646.1 Ceramide glucosyltransferase [Sinorhizobium fredii CCBAU 25509]KSV88675.1 ceramide glucosyltransferase [Sinorhizobium fredii USDA 205]MCG5473718.1 ceramide glucosyltransferase [Sinorhizobium fredii]MQX07048.1 glycosyltransferase [Sinorhizobium fredii]